MDSGAVRQLPVLPRHFALDERGVGLRATWHAEHGFVNLSLWSDDHCVQTFHLTPAEAGRLVGFLAGVLAGAAHLGMRCVQLHVEAAAPGAEEWPGEKVSCLTAVADLALADS